MESVVASSLLLLLLMLLLQSLAAFRLPESTPMRPSGWGRGRGRGMAPAAASAHGQYQHQQEPEPEEPNSRIRYCSPSTASSRQEYILNKMAAALVVGSVSFLGLSGAGSASAGDVGVEGSSPLLVAAVKASSLAEAQAAARNVKDCLQGVKDMQTAANEGDWATVAKILGSKQFMGLESTFLTLVRSSDLTAEDKVSLGTIKRFGLTADALITLGGLGSELRTGGVAVAGDSGGVDLGQEEDEEGGGGVNGPEARRFLRLARNALEDIDSITSTLLEVE